MKTYALTFSCDAYDRVELANMSAEELYDLACVASTVGYDEAGVMTLDELSSKVNDDTISLDSCWLYFVNVDK